jgi:aprataxin
MSFRDALQKYIDYPERHPELVLFSDENAVIIKDLFPKSMQHYLVLPRRQTHVHPLEVFQNDPEHYETIQKYVELAKSLMATDSVGRGSPFGEGSINDDFMNTFIMAGVHSVPSLRNLHIHVITKDFNSPRLKSKKHYNSFNTRFFVSFTALKPERCLKTEESVNPEDETDYESGISSDEDALLHHIEFYDRECRPQKKIKDAGEYVNHHNLLNGPLVCLHCGKNFGKRFSALKVHLSKEFQKRFKVVQ